MRYHIQFPGAWGGANWGSTAADPATGMLFVRSLEMPSYRRMSLVSTPKPGGAAAGARERRASNRAMTIYMQICSACHGPGQTPMQFAGDAGYVRTSAR